MIATRPASWTSPFAITIQERPSSVISVSAYRRGFVPARRINSATLPGDRLAMMSGSHSGVTPLNLRLAPMAAVTNAPFRLVARECGAGLLTSEEIDARALVQGNGHTVALARYLPEEHPIAMQLLGSDPDILAEAARRLEAEGADAIDLNMGCPVAKIVAKGQGAALMRDPLTVAVILRALRKAVGGPLTIMVRVTGCAAVMIGRGALGAPWIFTPGAVSRAEKAQIIRRHARLIEAHLESRTALVQLKKHLAWYANGLPFAARIRAELFAAPSAAAVRDAFWRLW